MTTKSIGWALLVVGIVSVLYAWRGRHPHTTSDFTLFYVSAKNPPASMYARPVGPPRANMNPPHFQLLTRPLTWLSLDAAASVWRLVNFAALVLCVWWIGRVSVPRWNLADYAALLSWAPMSTMVTLNQATWILWPPLLWAWWCWRRDRWVAGAVGLGIALSFKSFLGVFLLWLVVKRQWRAVGAAVITATAMFAVGVLAYGIEIFRSWTLALAAVSWWNLGMNASFRSILSRLFMEEGSVSVPLVSLPWMVNPLALVAGASVVIVTLLHTRSKNVDQSWATLMTSALLASPLGWIYYAWWILPGTRPSRLLVEVPLLWIPMFYMIGGRASPWLTLTIGSVYFWSLFLFWLRRMTDRRAQPVAGPSATRAETGLALRPIQPSN